MPTLKITYLEDDGERVKLFSTHTFLSLMLGRDPDSEVHFDTEEYPMVSRNHAAVEWDDDVANTLVVSDFSSANGTFLNGERIQESAPMKPGDVIQLGETGPRVRLDLSEEEVASRQETKKVPPHSVTEVTTAFPGESELEFEARLAVWRDKQRSKEKDRE